jgi:Bacterial Ig-like domain
MSPPGGEIDKIPPVVISTYPEKGTTNFDQNIIEFSFSEYVNKRNINEAFFISPLIDGLPEFSWTNKTVYVEFPDSLKKNTTYSVIIGTEITDMNNNNKMTEPYVLTFSTGSKIDSGKIKGKVYTNKADGTLLFAYKIDTSTVDIYNNKPTYLSQINEKGFYELTGLGTGSYSLFAVKDEFKDLVYNIGDDLIGIPTQNVKLTKDSNIVNGIDFLLHIEDTLSPNIQAVTMTDKNHIVVEFNEPIDSSKITISNFSIHDSTSNNDYAITNWFKTNSKKNEYILCLSDSLNIENQLYLQSVNIWDRFGNILISENTNFIASDKPDTNAVTFGNIETVFEKSQIDYLAPEFILNFSDGFESPGLSKAITMLTPDSNNVPLSFTKINDAKIEVKANIDFKPKAQYTIILDMNYFVDAAKNNIDTLIAKRVSTVSDLDFTGASGSVKSDQDNVKVILQEIKSSTPSMQVVIDNNNTFNFERVIPGQYLVWAYIDRDSNNAYSHGNVNPLEYAEYFKYYPDTLNLRPRWPVGDIEIDLTIK